MHYFQKTLITVIMLLLAAVTATAGSTNPDPGQPTVVASVTVNVKELTKRNPLTLQRSEKRSAAPQRLEGPGNLAVKEVSYPAMNVVQEKDPAPFAAPFVASPPAPAFNGFLAIVDNNTFIPPNTQGAVGPDHVMTTLSSEVRIQDKSGNVLTTLSLSDFFSGLTNANNEPFSPYQPHLRFDPLGNRWVLITAADAESSTAAILVAASETADPMGNWYLSSIRVDGTGASWAGSPNLGMNKDWIVVSANMYSTSDSTFLNANVYVVNKAQLYAGTAVTFKTFTDSSGGYALQPAVTHDASLGAMYLLESWTGDYNGNGYVRLSTITGAVGSEVFTPGTSYSSVASPWDYGTVGEILPQLGDPNKIDGGDDRILNCVYRNSSLWCAQTVYLPAASPTRSAAQWWQINPANGTVLQFGRVDDPNGINFYAYPTIAVNKNNDVLLGYSSFSAAQYPSAGYSFRNGTDAANTLQPSRIFKEGEAKYYKTYGGTWNSWGNYSSTVVDPADDLTLWTIQEYATTPADGYDRWSTWWAAVNPNADFTIAAAPASLSTFHGGTATAAISTTVTGSFNNTVSLSATGLPAGATATFGPSSITEPASGSATLWLTAGASTPAGTYTVTVTGTGGGNTRTATLSFTVTAGSGNTTTLFSDGFEAGGWSTAQVSGTAGSWAMMGAGAFPNAQPHGGAMLAGFNSWTAASGSQTRLYRNGGIAVPGTISTATLSFWMYHDTEYTNTDQVQVQASTDGTSWTNIGAPVNRYDGTTGWTQIDINVNAYKGQTLWLGFVGISKWGNDMYLDDVAITTVSDTSADFTLTAPSVVTATQGGSNTASITTAVSGSFNNAVSLSATGLPTGATASFSPSSIAAPGSGSSTLTLAAGASTPAGTYTVTVNGTGGGLTHTATVSFTVIAVPPDFTISAAPASLSACQGASVNATISTTITGSFNNAVSLSATGLPMGAAASFSPPLIAAPGSGSSTLTLTAGASTPAGTYTVTVTGTGDGLTHTTTLSFLVNDYPIKLGTSEYTTATKIIATLAYPSATKMQLSFDSAKWTKWEPYATTKTLTLSGADGVKTVYCRFMDVNGASSAIFSDAITLDKKKPTGTILINGGAKYTNTTNVALSLSATDANDIDAMQFSTDNKVWSDWELFTPDRGYDLPAGDGPKKVYVRYRDKAGNISAPRNAGIILDTLAPSGTIKINGGASTATSSAVTLTLSAKGAVQMQLSNDGASWNDWQPYATKAAWNLASGSGVRTVYVKYKDAPGNISTPFSSTISVNPPAGYCGSYTLNKSGNLGTDDDIQVFLNNQLIYSDGDHLANVNPPLDFNACKGDSLRVKGINWWVPYAGLPPINITKNSDGSYAVLDANGFGANGLPGDGYVFYNKAFVIPF